MTAPARRPRRLAATGASLLVLAAACRPAAEPRASAHRPILAASPAPSASVEAGGAFASSTAASGTTANHGDHRDAAPAAPADPDAPLFDLAEEDPRAALLAAEKLPPAPNSVHLRGVLLQRWAARDFAAALAHADALPVGDAREEMFARLAFVLAGSLPAEAAAIVARDMSPGPARTEAAISVLHRWSRSDPAAAARWAALFPDGALRERAARELAGPAAAPSPTDD